MKTKVGLSKGASILGASALVLALALAYANHWNWFLIASVIEAKIVPLFPHIRADSGGHLAFYGVDAISLGHIMIAVSALTLLVTSRSRIPGKRFWIASIPLILIAVLAGISRFWSISPSGSAAVYVPFLLFTGAALIFGATLSENTILWALEIFAAVTVVLSLIAVIRFPSTATMVVGGNLGWRGMFTHKNFFGPMMAFANLIFMVRLFGFAGQNWVLRIYRLCFYVLSLYALWRSNSVASMLALIAVCITFVLTLSFLRWGHYLKRTYWIMLAGAGAIGAILLWILRGPILQLFSRSSSLTGRLPLWSILTRYVAARPLLGYGFGQVFWHDYKDIIAARVFWHPPYAHNGFIELALGLGLIGAVFLLVFLLQTFLLDLRYFLRVRRSVASWPVLLFVLIVLVNMSESLLASHEFFLWTLLVLTFGFCLREFLGADQESLGGGQDSTRPSAPISEE